MIIVTLTLSRCLAQGKVAKLPLRRKQFILASNLHQAPPMQHVDPVCVPDRGQAVGDDNPGARKLLDSLHC